jgi:hypothetical protein
MGLTSDGWLRATAILLLIGLGDPAHAVDLIERGGFRLGLGLEAGAGYFLTENANFGLGRVDARSGENTGDAQWGEGYIEPSLDFGLETEGAGSLYGATSVIGALTVGDGDAGGFTRDDSDIDLELLHAGWRSGALLADSLGEDALDLSAGRQEFHVGDGFLIWDGDFDSAGDAVYWLGPRTAFDFAGVARLGTSPLGGQVFFLRGDRDQGHTEPVGVNLDYDAGFGTLGAMYMQIVDTDAGFDAETPRDGMQVATARLNDGRIPGFEDLALNAQYVKEFGDGDTVDFDAEAFYVEPSYTFSWLPWSPVLAYRFAYFSGDPDPGDNTREDFDPLFYDYSRGWGTWTQGEVVGEYLLFNSNQVNHMVHLSAAPSDAVGLGAIYYHFDLAERDYFGTPVSDKEFADEVDVYVDWTVTENLFIGAVYGVALPQEAAEELFGDDPFHVFQVYAIVNF